MLGEGAGKEGSYTCGRRTSVSPSGRSVPARLTWTHLECADETIRCKQARGGLLRGRGEGRRGGGERERHTHTGEHGGVKKRLRIHAAVGPGRPSRRDSLAGWSAVRFISAARGREFHFHQGKKKKKKESSGSAGNASTHTIGQAVGFGA